MTGTLKRRGTGRVTLGLRSILAAALVSCCPALAFAQATDGPQQSAPVQDVQGDHILVFGGGEIDFANSGFAGATIALPGSKLGSGFAVRGSGFGGSYSYNSSPNKIDATFYGGQVEGVYQLSGSGFWMDLGAGGRYVDTDLSPFDPTNRRHGAQGEFEVSIDGGFAHGPWRSDYYGSYGTRLEDYQGRVSLTHMVYGPFRAGAEFGFEGDPTYDLQRVGPYVGYALTSRSEVQATAGVSRQSGEGTGGYFRVLYYHSF